MKAGQDAASNRTSPTQNDSSQDAKSSTSVDLPEESPLYLAAKRYLLERESKESLADTLNDDRNSSLTPAAGNGFLDIAQRILHDTNQNNEGSYQQAFFTAAKKGHSDVLDLLLETFGLDVNATDGSGSTALHLAASNCCTDVVRTLLATEGIDINKKDKSDLTALDRALKKYNDVVDLLLVKEGLDWGAGLEDSIQEAARDGYDDLLDFLLAKECASVKDTLDPLSWSVLRGQMEVLRVLLSRHGVKVNAVVDSRRRTALSWAAQIGRADAVEMLLKHGADANIEDYEVHAPLYWALLGGKEEVIKKLIPVDTGTLLQLVFEGDIDRIEFMLRFGPNLDHRDGIGRTALHVAALLRRLDIATVLMAEGADLDIQDHSGRTPLQVALRGLGGGGYRARAP